jgi:hypothetical protein
MYSDSHSAWYALGYSRIIDVFNKSAIGSLRCCTASLAKHYSRRNHHLKAKWSNQYTKEHHENARGNVWQHSIQPKYMSVESSLILGTTALLLATHPHTTPRLTTITISTHIRRTPQSTRRSYSFSNSAYQPQRHWVLRTHQQDHHRSGVAVLQLRGLAPTHCFSRPASQRRTS